MIEGDYDYKTEGFPFVPEDGQRYTDLRYVRSYFGIMMGTPRGYKRDFFPSFPRDGDEERAEAYRDSLS